MWRDVQIINRWGLGPKCPLRVGYTAWTRAREPLGPHIHFGLELGVVLSGSISREYLGASLKLGPGQLWWVASCEPHVTRYLTGKGEVMSFLALPRALSGDPGSWLDWTAPFGAPPQSRPQLTRSDERRQAIRLARASLPAMDGSAFDVALAWVNLYSLIMMAWRGERARPGDARRRGRGAGTLGVTPALKLVEQSLPGPVSVQAAARACRLSRTAFCLLFKSTVGMSFGQYIQECRLAGAARDLLATDLALKTIAWQWRFSGASHLCRLFKRHYGCTPTDYRRRRDMECRRTP